MKVFAKEKGTEGPTRDLGWYYLILFLFAIFVFGALAEGIWSLEDLLWNSIHLNSLPVPGP